jgi:hypothetical protein
MFAMENPYKIDNLILNNVPLSFQDVYIAIKRHIDNAVEASPEYAKTLGILDKLETSDLLYHKSMIGQTVVLGLYVPKPQSEESLRYYKELNELKNPILSKTNMDEISGFYNSSNFTNQNYAIFLKRIIQDVRVRGIYADQDGWFDTAQHNKIKAIIGNENFKLIENSSFNIFIDQRDKFINTVLGIVR